jgi:ABC-2 type transport system ATP-binding protein
LFGRDYTDAGVRVRVGALIENAGCFPSSSVYQNLMMQAINLGLINREEEIDRVIKIVRMEDSKFIKFKSCSLGMKQRIGIAMALLGEPALLILDEPINGLDTDGMRIMREILVDITKTYGCTVLISSHILGELEKIATHYGIIRQGKMIKQMTAEQLDSECRTFVSINTTDNGMAKTVLQNRYPLIQTTENAIRVYDAKAEDVVSYLYEFKILTTEVSTEKIGLEEYYIDLMKENK